MVRNPNLRRILERLRHLMESIRYIFVRKCPELFAVPEQEQNASHNPGCQL